MAQLLHMIYILGHTVFKSKPFTNIFFKRTHRNFYRRVAGHLNARSAIKVKQGVMKKMNLSSKFWVNFSIDVYQPITLLLLENPMVYIIFYSL